MLLMFIAWLVATSIEARKQRSAAGAVLGESHLPLMILSCAVGLAFLVTAGKFIVAGARGLAIDFGIDEFVVGATIVAFGTSAPEIATTVIARVRGQTRSVSARFSAAISSTAWRSCPSRRSSTPSSYRGAKSHWRWFSAWYPWPAPVRRRPAPSNGGAACYC